MKTMNDAVGSVAASIVAKANAIPAKPEDFVRGGLLHCSICGRPKQHRLKLMGRETVVRCMCRCENARFEADRKEEQERDRRMRVQQLRVEGIQDPAMRKHRFEDAEETSVLAKCRRYAEHWDEIGKTGKGLLLWGDVGTGKTFAASCIANALIDRNVPVLMTSFPRILNTAGYDKSAVIKQMQQFSLVILDDFGVERQSDYALEIVQFVLDERYKSGHPLIVTTNLTLRDLHSPKNITCARMFDRLNEMCVPLHFEGISRRKAKAEENLRAMSDFLNLLESGAR